MSVDQTILQGPHANCLQACVATILGLTLEEVPNFMLAVDDWKGAFEAFMGLCGLQPLYLSATMMKPIWHPAGLHLIWGMSPRGTYHSVVGLCGETIHDPHPDKTGLLIQDLWTVFVVVFLPLSILER